MCCQTNCAHRLFMNSTTCSYTIGLPAPKEDQEASCAGIKVVRVSRLSSKLIFVICIPFCILLYIANTAHAGRPFLFIPNFHPVHRCRLPRRRLIFRPCGSLCLVPVATLLISHRQTTPKCLSRLVFSILLLLLFGALRTFKRRRRSICSHPMRR